MIKSGSTPCPPAIGQKIRFLLRLKWFFCLAVAVLFAVAAPAAPPDQATPDEQYIHIMTIIDRADALRAAGQLDAARVKYREAQTNLVNFRAYNPLFDPKTVAYRLNEVTSRLETRPPVPEPVFAATKPKANPEAEATTPASKSSVKLIEAGAEPREVLRLHVKPGDKQTAIMTMKISMEMPGTRGGPPGAGGKPMDIPAITIPMDVTIDSVAPNGDITYTAVLGEAGIVEQPGTPPQVAQTMKTAIAKIKGLTGTGVISSRGVSKKVDMKAPADADPQLRQSLDQMKESMSNMGVPVPEEAVGAGAKWEVKMPVKSGGMTIDQAATYQLTSVQGDRLETTVALSQNAANQKIQSPNMPGAQINLIELTSNGTGKVTSDLSKLVPSQATMDIHTDMKMETTMGAKKVPIAMKMGINMSMEAQ